MSKNRGDRNDYGFSSEEIRVLNDIEIYEILKSGYYTTSKRSRIYKSILWYGI